VHTGLDIDNTRAAATGSGDLLIGNGEASIHMACVATMGARFVHSRLVFSYWTRRLLTLAGVHAGVLIQADQSGVLAQKSVGLTRRLHDRASSRHERGRIRDVVPDVGAPGAKPFGFEPATHCAHRHERQARIVSVPR
jgi:hypothetical protein